MGGAPPLGAPAGVLGFKKSNLAPESPRRESSSDRPAKPSETAFAPTRRTGPVSPEPRYVKVTRPSHFYRRQFAVVPAVRPQRRRRKLPSWFMSALSSNRLAEPVLIAGLGSIGRRHYGNLRALGCTNFVFYRTYQSTLPDTELASGRRPPT